MTPLFDRSLLRRPGLTAAGLGILAFALYVRTLAPGLLPGDSGEFQVLARLPGHTHPTGYPIYLLLAHPFTWLPVGDFAFRANLFSAVMASLTVGLTYLIGRQLSPFRWPALMGVTALALSHTFWSQALIAEVYTTAAAFLAGICWALLHWQRSRHPGWLVAAGVLGGLSLGVHLTVALTAPAVLLFLVLARADRWAWAASLVGALVGLLLAGAAFWTIDWLHPIPNFIDAAIQPSRSVWGYGAADLDSPCERILFNVSGKQHQGHMFANPARTVPRNLFNWLHGLPGEFGAISLLLVGLGVLGLWAKERAVAGLFFGGLFMQWIFVFGYDVWDIYVFHIPAYLLMALLVVGGADALIEIWNRAPVVGSLHGMAGGLVGFLLLLILAQAALMPFWPAVRGGSAPAFAFQGWPVDEADNRRLQRQLTETVAALPADALVAVPWGELYPYYYVAHLQEDRGDLFFIEERPYGPGGQGESLIAFLTEQVERRPVFFSNCLDEIRQANLRCTPIQVGARRLLRVE